MINIYKNLLIIKNKIPNNNDLTKTPMKFNECNSEFHKNDR